MKLAVAAGAAVALCLALIHPRSVLAVGSGGDFIVRCFYNGHVAAMDPIMDPTSSTTDHLHVFFGNNIQGTSSFPSIKSGDSGGTGTMENNGFSPQTNCQDSLDTAGYWQPEPYMSGSPWLGPTGGGCQADCNASTIMHLRVYYLPNTTSNGGTPPPQEIPDGTIMVAGFPNGCTGVTDTTICSTPTTFPNDLSIVRYDCGADNNTGVVTPASAWPYNCNTYRDSDDSFNDGIVAFVDFPNCWNGHSDWTPPNGSPTDPKVPGYVAPWIPDLHAPTDGMGNRLNDFTYVNPGQMCPVKFPYAVPQIEERFHLLTSGPTGQAGFGEPSTCSNEGKNWNNLTQNAELREDTNTHLCPTPPPTSPSNNIKLSFACTPPSLGGDMNCTRAGQAGCSTGTCYFGADPVGWETFHADYWQTWQEGPGDVYGNGTDPTASPQGGFRDLIEDCTNGAGACSFINNTAPTPYPSPTVFGNEPS